MLPIPSHSPPPRRMLTRAAVGEPDASASVLFVGSSIISFWASLSADMQFPVLNRAVGGFRTSDLLEHADRLLGPPARASHLVVYYAGSNDLMMTDDSPAIVAARVAMFASLVRARGGRFVFLSSRRSPDRADWYHRVDDLNARCARLCEEATAAGHTSIYVDVNPVLSGRPELFKGDRLHLRKAGYAALAAVLKPALVAEWGALTPIRAADTARL